MMKILDEIYWQNYLETDYPDAKEISQSRGKTEYIFQGFIHKNGFQILCENYQVDESSINGNHIHEKVYSLLDGKPNDILQLILLSKFKRLKRKNALLKVAQKYLPEQTLKLCQKNEDNYDENALILGLFLQDPSLMEEILHWDIEDKKGHAPFLLNQKLSSDSFFEWCIESKIDEILTKFGSKEEIELRRIYREDEQLFLFIVRDAQRDSLRIKGEMEFGNKPEWIVLNFQKNPSEMSISAKRIPDAVEVANEIIRQYSGIPDLEYLDAKIETPVEKIDELLKFENEDISLIEIKFENFPLTTGPTVLIKNNDSITDALEDLSKRVDYNPWEDKENIKHIVILYNQRKIKLLFEWVDDSNCILRFTDRNLHGSEKTEFVEFMQRNFGIKVISTEKKSNR